MPAFAPVERLPSVLGTFVGEVVVRPGDFVESSVFIPMAEAAVDFPVDSVVLVVVVAVDIACVQTVNGADLGMKTSRSDSAHSTRR